MTFSRYNTYVRVHSYSYTDEYKMRAVDRNVIVKSQRLYYGQSVSGQVYVVIYIVSDENNIIY